MFKPVVKESRKYITLAGECVIRYIVCENENVCRECWQQSINELNRIGNNIDFRTVWRTKQEEVEERSETGCESFSRVT